MKELIKTIQLFNIKVNVLLSLILVPILSLATDVDPPTTSPWGTGGLTNGNADPTKTFANMFIEVLRYAALIVGGLILIGGAIYIWTTINMPKEEKEHHNIPVRILMGVAGVFAGLFMAGYAITGLSA